MYCDDCKVCRQRCCSVSALSYRQAEQDGIGKQAAKTNSHTVLPGAFKQKPCPEQAKAKAQNRTKIKAAKQCEVKGLSKIQSRDRAKQQAWDCEGLGEFHQSFNATVRKPLLPNGKVPKPDNDKHGQDNLE